MDLHSAMLPRESRVHDRGKLNDRAFTMIELLIVIGIIAVLAVMAVPSINNVLLKSGGAKSTANLRQIGTFTLSYATDNDGKIPVSPWGHIYHWMEVLYPMAYNGKSFPGVDAAGTSLKGTVFHSPNLKPSEPEPRRSYGWNDNLRLRSAAAASDPRLRLASLARPARTAMCGDSLGSSTMGTFLGGRAEPTLSFRNAGFANILFADGHVEALTTGQIPQKTTDSEYRVFWNVQ